jgi:glycosyltransferase involved in cell wall biosynthesis
MRIGLIIYGSLDTLSGGYLYDRKLVEYLRSQGDEVEVISFPWRSYFSHLGDNLSRSWLRALERQPLDLLLQDELNHPSLFYLNQRLRRRVAYPMVAIVHHLLSSEARPTWQNRFYRSVERRYLASLDGFIFNSQTTRRTVQALVGERQPALIAYPAGDRLNASLPEERITARCLEAGPLRILFLGNVIPRKGLHTLLDALEGIQDGLWALSIAGSLSFDRDYARSIMKLISAHPFKERILFLGPLGEQALTEQFEASHVLAVPSSYEGFGIAYLEGMGSGLPAIATRAGAAVEIITHGRDGFLIDPGDPQALAGYLRLLANDRQRLLAMSLAARDRFRSHPTWEQTGAAIREFLAVFPRRSQKG